MAATPSLKVVKSFTYRGVTRSFSNRYHFAGGTPANTAAWTTFSDAVVTAEKAIFSNVVTITGTYGYIGGSELPVFSKTYSTLGTLTIAGFTQCPGDVAAIVRYSTAVRTSRNHPVYLYNYYHAAYVTAGIPDAPAPGYKTAIQTYAGAWLSPGFSDGTTSYTRAGPNGASATGQVVNSLLTHRDLPR